MESVLKYDICIVGAGMMGLAMANEMKESGKKICVIESGFTSSVSKQKKVLSTDLVLKNNTRERGLGGSTQTWWGLTGLLDSLDLMNLENPVVDMWPIKYSVLQQYCKIAAGKYDFPPLEIFLDEEYKRTLITSEDTLVGEVFAAKKPVRFAEKYSNLFERDNVDLINNTTVAEVSAKVCGRVDGVKCLRKDGANIKEIYVEAKIVVLTAGGIENSRILLNSKNFFTLNPQAPRNVVGRFIMNHPKGFYGFINNVDYKKLKAHLVKVENGIKSYIGIALSQEERKRLGLSHSYVQLVPEYPWLSNNTFLYLVNQKNKFLKISVKEKEGFSAYNEKKKNWDLLDLIQGLYYFVHLSLLKICKLEPSFKNVRIRNYIDIAPRYENCISLSTELDEYGMPIPEYNIKISEHDKKSLIKIHTELKKICEIKNLGKYVGDLSSEKLWPIATDAAHHMGGARMGVNSKTSVVDADLKMHGIENLYVAGTSAMPTGGNINPSLVGLALSVRLAEHLNESFI